jgi:transcriptional regulator with XRE-family HTH domain/tetratricopeptide (TPR) repeat protein
MASLPDLLRQLRLDAGLTIQSLADSSTVSPRAISDIERGISTAPRRNTVVGLAAALGLDAAERDQLLAAARRSARRQAAGRHTTVPPVPVSDFTGRDVELAGLAELLTTGQDPRTIAVSGSPGIGKTSVALEAIRRTERAALFVDLDGLGTDPLTPVEVLQALLRQVPAVGEGIPDSADALAALWRTVVAEQQPIVLLDNAGSEAQVRPVVAPRIRGHVVVTSRRVLSGLAGAHHVVVGTLTTADSVRLLASIVPAPQREGADLVELARLCDHVPLALRIAGNRVAARADRTVQQVSAGLRSEERRLGDLVSGDLAVEASFELSHRGLDARTAALFHAVAVTDGHDFDAGTAAALADVDVDEAQDGLDTLADLGLLEPLRNDRFRLHDLIALFALQHLRAGGPGVEAEHRFRLRRRLLERLERAGAWFEPGRDPAGPGGDTSGFPDAGSARAWIEREWTLWWPAFREASAAGEDAIVLDVADALHWYSDLWSQWGHWRDLFTLSAASAVRSGDRRLEAMHLGYVAWAELRERADEAAAIATARSARAAALAVGDRTQEGWALAYEAWAASRLPGEAPRALDLVHQAIAAFAESGDEQGRAQAENLLTIVLERAGDGAAALAALRGVVEHARAAHRLTPDAVTSFTLASSLRNASRLLRTTGDLPGSLRAADEAIELASATGWNVGHVLGLLERGDTLAALDRPASAREAFARSLQLLDEENETGYAAEWRAALLDRLARPRPGS